MPRAAKSSIPKKFEMLKAQKQFTTTKFVMGRASTPAAGTKSFEMLKTKPAGKPFGSTKTMEMKTCL